MGESADVGSLRPSEDWYITTDMARARIILETSNQRKSAMVEAASLQGATLVDWFEEQVEAAIPRISRIQIDPLHQLESVTALENPGAVFKGLSLQDWSFTNDDTRYLTHDVHPYPAKFIPQIPAHLISRLSMPGDIVLDPFGGSATTAVEAVRLGRRALSLDANPISALIGRVKTGFVSAQVRADLEQLCATVEGHLVSVNTRQNESGDVQPISHQKYVPNIPNVEKWFSAAAIRELALVRHLIEQTTDGLARDAAQVALSRIIIRVSNQESETRYVAVPKGISTGLTLRAYLEALKAVTRRLETAMTDLQYADARFMVGDSRHELVNQVGENSADLIVTSPPYPNATDYHLYHRFRLFWLGFDPRKLGHIEIGSHLRHQRNGTGFEEYVADMSKVLDGCRKVLAPGRYAVFIVGDALFKGEDFSTSSAICESAKRVGFEVIGVVKRPIHTTKRSFVQAARRARCEQLVILRKPNLPVTVLLNAPAYRMWKYEEELRLREVEALTGTHNKQSLASKPLELTLRQPALWHTRRLTFTRDVAIKGGISQPTWQSALENGDSDATKRKDPKYATHGLHPFKGKFYPQLAKSLLNISNAPVGACLFDPYCGSGTTLLEGMLNGFVAYGCDFNPLAAKIAYAKTAILSEPRDLVELSTRSLLDRLVNRYTAPTEGLEQFATDTHEELISWFPKPVLFKLNWLLAQVRLFGNQTLVSFFEIIISSLIREVSYQDPTDLRIRRRKETLADAPVLELFRERLEQQQKRLQKYWAIAGRQPGQLFKPTIVQGDSRKLDTVQALGLKPDSVDCVVTSPPYATALPYIDTDRLSLLAIMGLTSHSRANFEENLTGSREMRRSTKEQAETALLAKSAVDELPAAVLTGIRSIYRANTSVEVGFRRANMAALLWRYFIDMRENLLRVREVLKPGAKAFYVVGNSRTNAGGTWVQIETCKNIALIGEMAGLNLIENIDIDVTTENYKHIKNAITENQVIVFRKA